MGSGPRQVWSAVPPVRIHGAQDKLEPTVPGQVSLTTCGGHSQERALIAPQRVERSAPLLRHERPASPILVRETRRVDLTGGRCVIAGLSGVLDCLPVALMPMEYGARLIACMQTKTIFRPSRRHTNKARECGNKTRTRVSSFPLSLLEKGDEVVNSFHSFFMGKRMSTNYCR